MVYTCTCFSGPNMILTKYESLYNSVPTTVEPKTVEPQTLKTYCTTFQLRCPRADLQDVMYTHVHFYESSCQVENEIKVHQVSISLSISYVHPLARWCHASPIRDTGSWCRRVWSALPDQHLVWLPFIPQFVTEYFISLFIICNNTENLLYFCCCFHQINLISMLRRHVTGQPQQTSRYARHVVFL